MKRYYHATKYANLNNIIGRGILPGCDGLVYLAETKEDAMKFVAIRLINEPIMVLEVELDPTEVFETFDHSYTFFKCRAFGYGGCIPYDQVTDAWVFAKNS